MFEDSVSSLPSIWASMNSWFTPTVLFLFLNVMIVTIVTASNLSTSSQKHQDPQNQNHHGGLARSPSVLQRIKSINLYHYRSPEPHPATAAVAAFDKSPDNSENTHYIFQHTHQPEQPQFTRSPSLLQRLKSFNFYIPQDYTSNPPHPIAVTAAAATTTLQKLQGPESKFEHDHFEDEDHLDDEDHFEVHEDPETEGPESEREEQSLDEIFSQLKPLQDHHVNRTKSDAKPRSGEMPTKLPKKMKKSASSKSTFAHFQEEDIVEIRRPATVREKKHKVTDDDDEEVDAKADDFINKFKQQLKLQRLDSIVRYKDMINRGA